MKKELIVTILCAIFSLCGVMIALLINLTIEKQQRIQQTKEAQNKQIQNMIDSFSAGYLTACWDEHTKSYIDTPQLRQIMRRQNQDEHIK